MLPPAAVNTGFVRPSFPNHRQPAEKTRQVHKAKPLGETGAGKPNHPTPVYSGQNQNPKHRSLSFALISQALGFWCISAIVTEELRGEKDIFLISFTGAKMKVRYATKEDAEFLVANRRHISASLMREKIEREEVYVVELEGKIIGWARYGLFWDNMPFLNMIHFFPEFRRRGFGSALLGFWESEMRRKGHCILLTSTQSDEEGQFFYRRLGYQDAGVLLLPDEPAELILLKHVSED